MRIETITRFIRAEDFIFRRSASELSGLLIVSFLQLRYSGAYMRVQDPQGEQDERKKIENFGLDRNGTFSVYVCIIHSPNMGRRSRTQNAVYTAFSCRGQLHYMDGLRTFKRKERLPSCSCKFTRSNLWTACNNYSFLKLLIKTIHNKQKLINMLFVILMSFFISFIFIY